MEATVPTTSLWQFSKLGSQIAQVKLKLKGHAVSQGLPRLLVVIVSLVIVSLVIVSLVIVAVIIIMIR